MRRFRRGGSRVFSGVVGEMNRPGAVSEWHRARPPKSPRPRLRCPRCHRIVGTDIADRLVVHGVGSRCAGSGGVGKRP